MTEHQIWAEIDLDAIRHNIQSLRLLASPPAALMAVIKADAYGHGAPEVARTALSCGVQWLAVARIDEGIRLRLEGIAAPILVLGGTLPSRMEDLIRYQLTPALFSDADARVLSDIALRMGKVHPVHLKFDTGMGRIGFAETGPDAVIKRFRTLSALPGLRIQGVFTHFASADTFDKAHANAQNRLFSQIMETLEAEGLRPPIAHAANSAAIMEMPETHFDLVRAGIAMYGIYPSREVDRSRISLIPAMTLKARILCVKTIEAGQSVSYNRTWTAKRRTRVATLPVGYADGFSRAHSNRGVILTGGLPAPIIGRVCMDLLMIDVTEIPGVSEGDEAILFGQDEKGSLPAEELAERIGTIPYEIVSSLTPRVPRLFDVPRKTPPSHPA